MLQDEAVVEERCVIAWENHSTTVFWYSAFRVGLWIPWTVPVMAVLDECFSADGAKLVLVAQLHSV